MAQRITTDKVHVYGPASGASNSNEKRTSSGAVLKRLLPYLAPFRLQLGFAFVLVIVTALVQAAGPALIGQAIDFYIVERPGPHYAPPVGYFYRGTGRARRTNLPD